MSVSTETPDETDEEDTPEAETFKEPRDMNALDIVAKLVPEQDNFRQKTVLEKDEEILITQVKMLPKLYPEIDELEGVIDFMIDDLSMNRTQIGGAYLKMIKDVVITALGGQPDENESPGEKLAKLITEIEEED